MKISVIMIDGGFRENVYSAEYCLQQTLPRDEYEVIWVEHGVSASPKLAAIDGLTILTLGLDNDRYHASRCFNAGIKHASGELIVIIDADQIVPPDFLEILWQTHARYDKLACYVYRFDEEPGGNTLDDHSTEELARKCKLNNPGNFGACLSIRKRWLTEINGFEEHELFASGFHANDCELNARLKNSGVAVMWHPTLRVYHPWHPFTRAAAPQYEIQHKVIRHRAKNLKTLPFVGLDQTRNTLSELDSDTARKLGKWQRELEKAMRQPASGAGLLKRLLGRS